MGGSESQNVAEVGHRTVGVWGQCGQQAGGARASQTLKAHSGEEGDVAGLQGALMCTLRRAGLWLRLSSQRGVVHLAALGLEDPDVGWHSIAAFHLHQVAHHKLICIDLELVPVPDHSCLLWGRSTRVEVAGAECSRRVGRWKRGEVRTYGREGGHRWSRGWA